ncbi:hypothetical protein CROQUDRAFT_100181 [Cronartium quercuum f. sp. fusiforme G11]|uniref:Uncharacterized protein n=1 Tax=Cronartium quercuum f. sp. fusiforme G11 TaxID=708437 RepID=A0A9P6NAP8_9BASI|nr:hypothetical protein CROQUDRAFT_100181 [Cronartium quercuum f. sp. fusiforme G11]
MNRIQSSPLHSTPNVPRFTEKSKTPIPSPLAEKLNIQHSQSSSVVDPTLLRQEGIKQPQAAFPTEDSETASVKEIQAEKTTM